MEKSKHTVSLPIEDYEVLTRTRQLMEKIFTIAKHAEDELEKMAERSYFERAEVSKNALYKILGRIQSD